MSDLIVAAKMALKELNLIDTVGFDEERYAERRRANEALWRSIRDAEQEEIEMELNFLPNGHVPEEPEWLTEQSQLFLENISNLTRDEEAQMIPESTVIFFL